MAILVSGSLAHDYIMDFQDSFRRHIMPDQIHILNVCFPVDKMRKSWGGTAGNIAFAMKLLGGDPLIISAVGKDSQEYLNHLGKCGLNLKYVKKDDGEFTAAAYITTDIDDNQIAAFFNGPTEMAVKTSVKEVAESVKLAIVSPNYKEVMKKHLRECFEKGLETVFDPGQQITAFEKDELRNFISKSDFVIGNDYEIKLLSDKIGWSVGEIIKSLKALIITLGAKGSVINLPNGEKIAVSVCPPKSLDDPTGAGDAYRAGFFTGYEKGFDWKVCAQMGSVAASYAVETFGTQEYNFTGEEFCKRYEETYNEELKL